MTPYALQSAVEARDAAALEILLDREECEGMDVAERWALAQSIAHDPVRLRELKSDGTLVYADLRTTIDGHSIDLDEACDVMRVRLTMGRHDEAEAIARDMTDAIAERVDALIARGRLA